MHMQRSKYMVELKDDEHALHRRKTKKGEYKTIVNVTREEWTPKGSIKRTQTREAARRCRQRRVA